MKPRKPDGSFPGNVDGWLPPYEEIPAEFKKLNQWTKLISSWFFNGLSKDTEFYPKPGIDSNAALRHVGYCMRSWEPQHEHKEAGCGYLMSLWFDKVVLEDGTVISDA